jgi:hypothetical protein
MSGRHAAPPQHVASLLWGTSFHAVGTKGCGMVPRTPRLVLYHRRAFPVPNRSSVTAPLYALCFKVEKGLKRK